MEIIDNGNGSYSIHGSAQGLAAQDSIDSKSTPAK
jgi:hypothetical protein